MEEQVKKILIKYTPVPSKIIQATRELLNLFSVSARTFDPDYDEVDCEHYKLEQGAEDITEHCHLGIGIDNCAHCYKNKALYVR